MRREQFVAGVRSARGGARAGLLLEAFQASRRSRQSEANTALPAAVAALLQFMLNLRSCTFPSPTAFRPAWSFCCWPVLEAPYRCASNMAKPGQRTTLQIIAGWPTRISLCDGLAQFFGMRVGGIIAKPI